MDPTNCPDCGKPLPVDTPACPHCGNPLHVETMPATSPVALEKSCGATCRRGKVVVLLVVLLAAIWGIYALSRAGQ